MNEVKRIKNKIIDYIKINKPVDLWQDKLEMLNEKRYIDFIIFVHAIYEAGKLVDLTIELSNAIQKELLGYE